MEQLMNPAQEQVPAAGRIGLRFPEFAQLTTQITRVVERYSYLLLRISLGVVFLWFGILKFTPFSPVAKLVADTVPFVPAKLLIPALATFEVVLGIGLLLGKWTSAVVAVMIAHLSGTFLVLVIQPAVAFQNGNPLELTMTGEFVVKNLVLITAGLVLVTRRPKTANRSD
jgi:uncharacterized membrane protein YphA (DoxX/SURF4 family)